MIHQVITAALLSPNHFHNNSLMASEGFQSSHWYVTDLNLSLQFHHHGLVIIAIVIISIILFISFLLCNFLRQCSTQMVSINETAGGRRSMSGVAVVETGGNSKGLDEATINSLPIFLHSSNSEAAAQGFQEYDECSICLCCFEENEIVKVIPKCLHLYHSQCVDKWLQNHAVCPLCRAPLHNHSSSSSSSPPLELEVESFAA